MPRCADKPVVQQAYGSPRREAQASVYRTWSSTRLIAAHGWRGAPRVRPPSRWEAAARRGTSLPTARSSNRAIAAGDGVAFKTVASGAGFQV